MPSPTPPPAAARQRRRGSGLLRLAVASAVLPLALAWVAAPPASPAWPLPNPCRHVPAQRGAQALCMAQLRDDAGGSGGGGGLTARLLDVVRNVGLVRGLSDGSALATGLRRAVDKPALIGAYLRPQRAVLDVTYGAAAEQRLDVVPRRSDAAAGARPVVLFFHGGAWGSGTKLFYRNFARRLSDEVDATVAVVGYPVYPTATAWGQVSSVALATRWARSPAGRAVLGAADVDAGVLLCGHSSGAHITSLSAIWAAEDVANAGFGDRDEDGDEAPGLKHMIHAATEVTVEERLAVLPDGFVGLAGVYDIRKHYAFETSRGVADVSPMKPACGGSPKLFDAMSPAQEVERMSDAAAARMPKVLLVHGDSDEIVPYSSTNGMAEALASARERAGAVAASDASFIIEDVGHAEVVTEIAFEEDETPSVDKVFPLVRRFVDEFLAEQTR